MVFAWQRYRLRTFVIRLGVLVAIGAMPAVATDDDSGEFADIHVHYNWDQKELIDADAVAAKLERENIAFTVVSATPTHLVGELKQAGGDRIVAFFSPYIHELGRRDWYQNPDVLRAAESGLAEGLYQGIGEVHFMVGFAPSFDNEIFLGLMRLGRQYDVPLLVHVDAGNERAFLKLCSNHPQNRFIFAHAGGNLRAEHIRRIIAGCDNVLVEFSARDPWRYDGLTDEHGQLLPDWRKLVIAYPDRFATGTDPVWRVTKTQSWDEPDEGWDHFETLLDYHRLWLSGLPEDVAKRVRLENARRYLRLNQ